MLISNRVRRFTRSVQLLLALAAVLFSYTTQALVSDDFSAGALNAGLWTVVNPLGDSSVSVSGNALRIAVASGADHDIWTSGNRAVRVLQPVSNSNFEMEAKFESIPQPAYQLMGFLVEQDVGNFIRFDVYSDGSGVNLFAASFSGTTPTVYVNQRINVGATLYLRVARTGNQWTYSYSANGTSWTFGTSFTKALTVSRAGVSAGNAGSNPAFTAVIDYFFNTASPIVPEDGAGGSGPVGALVSDDFSAGPLNTSRWTFVNPLGDGSASVAGNTLQIVVPTGANHDVWSGGNRAPRVMQVVNNTDFSMDAKFESVPQQAYQLQGFVVEQDSGNFIRFDAFSDGAGVNLFAASFSGLAPTVHVNQRIAVGAAIYLKVSRVGNQWTFSHSQDGTAWTVGGTFNKTLEVSRVGVFAGNAGSNPAFTAVVDYVFNTASPIVPEDGSGGGSPPGGLVSDDFTSSPLNATVWSFVNPLGDSSASITNGALQIAVAAGADHDMWTSGNRAPRVMQSVINADFEMQVKFLSIPQLAFQLQGIVVEQDPTTYLRFDLYSDGTSVNLFAASLNGASPTIRASQSINVGAVVYLRLKRLGNQWTYSYSLNGDTWTIVTMFSQALTVTRVGVAAGNAGSNPAFTAKVDYVLNVGGPPGGGGEALGEIAVNVVGGGSVSRNPNLESYTVGQVVTLTATANAGWAFANWSGAVSGGANPINLTVAGDHEVTATFTNLPPAAGLFVSDDFHSGTLNPGVWVFVNPLGDSSASVSGNSLRITVPGGISHDPWTTGNNAPRVMQVVNNTDFEVKAKFQSIPYQAYQEEGIMVEQDAGTFLRFDVYSDWTGVYLFAANFAGGNVSVRLNQAFNVGAALYLRVTRLGNQWTYAYSLNGQDWTVATTFNLGLTVSRVGVFAGNAGTCPAMTAVIDYVFNTASPISSEDEGQFGVEAALRGQGTVSRNPDQSAYSAGQTVQLTAMPAPNWNFVGWTGGVTGTANPASVLMDRDVEVLARFTPANAAAIVDVWSGDYQVFGQKGIPQRWVNILGRILLPSQVSSLSYNLNGQFQSYLFFRAGNSPRLVTDGDFNIELDYLTLPPGTNTVTIRADLFDGSVYQRNVVVNYDAGHQWPQTYSIDWSQVGNINDVAQIVDGNWAIEGGGVRCLTPGYDRLVAIGDVAWTDYEVTVPVTVHSLQPAPLGFAPGVGLLMRWQGHHDWNGERPRIGWHPVGAVGWTWWSDPNVSLTPSLTLLENDGSRFSSTVKPFSFGSRYIFKLRVETIAQPSDYKALYSLKVWPDGQAEPGAWDVVHAASQGSDAGSLVLLSHFADTTFGNVIVAPVPPH